MKTPRSSESKPIKGDASPFPVLAAEASLNTLRSHRGLLSRAWGWLRARNVERSSTRRLRVAETVSLGEKRFVAVVQVDGRHFLLAGGPSNIVLLAQLDAKDAFEEVLKKTLTVAGKQVAKRERPAKVAKHARVDRTNSLEDLLQKTTTAGSKQPAKRASKQNGFGQRPASAPAITHLNGAENFGDVLEKTMFMGRQPGIVPRKQNSKSTAQQTGYYA
jgi:flagellar biogenesis protein FliO